MKLKPSRDKQPFFKSVKDIYSVSCDACPTSISIDVNGCAVLENFRKILNYNNNSVAVETSEKIVYIYGEDIKIVNCNRYTASVCGEITKIEIFQKEV